MSEKCWPEKGETKYQSIFLAAAVSPRNCLHHHLSSSSLPWCIQSVLLRGCNAAAVWEKVVLSCWQLLPHPPLLFAPTIALLFAPPLLFAPTIVIFTPIVICTHHCYLHPPLLFAPHIVICTPHCHLHPHCYLHLPLLFPPESFDQQILYKALLQCGDVFI